MGLEEEQRRTLCKNKMKLSFVKWIVWKIKEKTKKVKKFDGVFFFFGIVSADVVTKFRYISILFNILILDVPTMQIVCHVSIFR